MGANSSKLEKALAECPDDERYYGFENFGNTCYANSVLQALYFCRPFRERVLAYASTIPKDADEDMLTSLADLFQQVGASCLVPAFSNHYCRPNEHLPALLGQDPPPAEGRITWHACMTCDWVRCADACTWKLCTLLHLALLALIAPHFKEGGAGAGGIACTVACAS